MSGNSFNSQLGRILVVGRDVSELSAEANLLTQAGYTTDLVITLEQAVRRSMIARYNLAIVSATFTYDEQIAIRARLKQVKPALRTLLLGKEHRTPDGLLSAVSDCLRKARALELNPSVDEPRNGGFPDEA